MVELTGFYAAAGLQTQVIAFHQPAARLSRKLSELHHAVEYIIDKLQNIVDNKLL